MKPLIYILAFTLTSCTVTQVKSDHWQLSRVSILQQVTIPSVTVSKDGTASMNGYGNDGGSAAVAAAVTAAIHAIK